MHWVYLAAAIALEVAGTTCLKLTRGEYLSWPALGVVVCYLSAFSCLGLSLKVLDLSVAYAIWCAGGIALIAVIGVVFFGEALGWVKLAGFAAIIAGVVALQWSSRQVP